MKRIVAILLTVLLLLTCAACGASSSDNAGDEEQQLVKTQADYDRTPIFRDALPMAFTYVHLFQMAPMAISGAAADPDATLFLQCVVTAANNNGLGYPAGSRVSGLTITYDILDPDGNSAASGLLQALNASDGPCYGANIKLESGVYAVHLVMHSPQKSGYGLISDPIAGPEKTFADWFADGAVEITQGGWNLDLR